MSSDVSRRELFAAAAALGIGSATFQRSVAAGAAAQPKGETITAEMVKNAEWVAGVTLTDDERKSVAGSLADIQRRLGQLRKTEIGYDIAPAVYFNPTPWEVRAKGPRGKVEPTKSQEEAKKPDSD